MSSPRAEHEARDFIADLEPFLFDRAVTFVDIGANVGSVHKALISSAIRLRHSHLIEPNPQTFVSLEQTIAGLAEAERPQNTSCHNLAISAAPGRLVLRDQGTMTHVVTRPPEADGPLPAALFEIEAITLDAFAQAQGITHVDLLKVDVEGHELAVFEGARELLESQAVDVIYVEAGVDPASTQHTYYRAIEDRLNASGYHLFRIYEQKNEWISDAPFLRRVNMAFMSTRFAAANPYKVSCKLFEARREAKAFRQENTMLTERLEARQVELEKIRAQLAEAQEKRTEFREKKEALEARVSEHKREMDALREAHAAETGDLHGQLEARFSEMAVLTERLEAQQADLERTRAQLAEAQEKRTEFREKKEALEAWRNEHKSQIDDLKKQLAARFSEIAVLTSRLERQDTEMQKMLSSTSWKITAPARKMIDAARGRRKSAS